MWTAIFIFVAAVALGLYLRERAVHKQTAGRLQRVQAELAQARESLEHGREQSRAHQQAVFNSMLEGVLLLDSTGRVHTTNKSMERLFGLEQEIRGLTIMEAFRNHDLLELVERVQKDGQVRAFELALPGIHHTRYLEVNAAAIRDPEKEQDEIILIFHDFTRIKELENVRRDFVANVSHELRTPLTLIKGYVETLIDGAKDDPAVAGRFLQTIHKHANRLTFLIEDLLTISQLESGRILMSPQRIPLRPLAERVLDELQSPAAEKGITMINTVPEELKLTADAERLQQVLSNLVDNSIKYGRAQGRVEIGATQKPESVEIVVKDDGPGIPAEACERVFERFYRVDRARSREQGGTGLGLAIVKHITQAHGGEVWVESEPGKSCAFFVSIPHTAAVRQGAEGPAS